MQKLVIALLLTTLLASCASYKAKEAAEAGKPAPILEGSTATAAQSADTSALGSSSASSSSLGKNGSSSSASRPASGAGSEAGADSASAASRSSAAADAQSAAAGLLSKRSVYYPLDVYVVQDADKPVVQAHAQYLSEHPNIKVRLEGNCDERGSTEYNLALGQRRADGVKKMLLLGGVKDSQIEAVSYGEERPKATGHDEASWAQNRRTDLNYGG
jgi:peptidoglycan-associated lipoprotein